MKKIMVNIKERSYPILVGYHILPELGKHAASLKIGADAVIVTNRLVKRLYGPSLARSLAKSRISVKFFEVPDGEKSKSEKIAFSLIQRIARYDQKKKIFIVALGGGVIGDLAGFVAGVYKRGVPLIHVPTTFLSQIDSSIGGKTAIDLSLAKNQVGVFHQPRLVLSDVATLKSLSLRQIRNGLAEAIKYGVIKDKGLFDYIESHCDDILSCHLQHLTHVVEVCSAIKAFIVGKDERETRNLRTVLNFGHTIGHGIEAASVYGRYQHGEAVALGMRMAASMSVQLDLCTVAQKDRLERLLTKAGLPDRVTKVGSASILSALAHDKKNISKKSRFVLMTSIGSTKIMEVPQGLVRKTLSEYLS